MQQTAIQRQISGRNAGFFEAEPNKLEGWADNLNLGLEREFKEAQRAVTVTMTLDDKLATQNQIRVLVGQRNQKRRTLFDAQGKVDEQRNGMIANIEGRLHQSVSMIRSFLLRWQLT